MTRYSQNANKAYLANCIELVDKTIRLANQPPLDTHDSLARAREWHDALAPNIPLERLPEVFARALADHTSSFPVNAFEMLSAWNAIRNERAQERERERLENPVKFCDMKHNHVNEHGDVEIALGGIKEVYVPCQFCRRSAYDVRIEEEMKKFREEANPKAVKLAENPTEVIMQEFREVRERFQKAKRPVAKTARGILMEAIIAGGDRNILLNAIEHVRQSK